MTKQEFIEKLKKNIQTSMDLDENTLLDDIPEWDSLAMLGLLALFDELEVEIGIEELEECKSIKDILQKAGIES